MSGGSLDYFYSTLEEHVGDFGDKELDDLVNDLAALFHEREWYLSGDTNEGNWEEARKAFKEKWFTPLGRSERIEKYLAEIREDVMKTFGLSDRFCKNCKYWTEEGDGYGYGDCEHVSGCVMHGYESCDRFDRKG